MDRAYADTVCLLLQVAPHVLPMYETAEGYGLHRRFLAGFQFELLLGVSS